MPFAQSKPHVHENVQTNSLFAVPTDNTRSHFRTRVNTPSKSLSAPYSHGNFFLPLANSCSVSEKDLSLENGSYDDILLKLTNDIQKLQESTQILQNVHSTTEYCLRNIPTFAGNVNEDFEEWRRKFLNKIEFLSWPPEQQILLLDDALTGRANLFFRQLPAAIKHSMPAILCALTKQYSSENIDLAERAMLSKRKQLPGESLDDYTFAILQIVQLLQMNNKMDKVSFYNDGLDADIRGDVYKMKPSSIEQAEKDARLAISVHTLQTKNLAAQIGTDSHSDSEANIVEPQVTTSESAPVFSCSVASTGPPAQSEN